MVGEPLLPFIICTGLLTFSVLTWTSLPKRGKNTQLRQVAWVCTCESELENQANPGYSVFFSRPICSVLVSDFHKCKPCRTTDFAGTAQDCYVPYHVMHAVCSWAWSHDKHTLTHTEGERHGRYHYPVSLRAVPPQLHCRACQPCLIGMLWIALPLHGTGQDLTKRA